MRYSNYLFTLDVHKTLSQVSIPVTLGDTARQLFIGLTDGGKPYIIPDGCRATLSARKADGNCLLHDCIIEKNTTIRYDFTEQTASAEGMVKCQILLYGKNGRLIASPRFTMVVYADIVGYDVLSESDLQSIGRMLAAEQERVAAENARVEAERGRVAADIARDEKLNEALGDLGNRVTIDYAKNAQMDLANANLFAWNLARQTVPIFGGEIKVDTASGFEGYRINKVGVKVVAAGNVRFTVCEVQENVLKHIADIGVAAVDSETLIAELIFDEDAKPFVQNEHTVILACADGAIIQGIPSNDAGGLTFSGLIAFDDADYYGSEDGTEITYFRSTTDVAGVVGATLFDIDYMDHFALRDFIVNTRTRLDDIEESIPDVRPSDNGKYMGVQNGKYALLPFPEFDVTTDPTLTKEGGIADAAVCGAKFADVMARLSELEYVPIAITAISSNYGNVEIGRALSDVKLNWTLNKAPTMQSLKMYDASGSGGMTIAMPSDTREYNVPGTISSYIKFVLTASDGKNTAEASTVINILNGVYYGGAAAPAAYDSAFVRSLTKKLASSRKGTYNVTAGDGQYSYVCYPVRFGAGTFVVNNFEGGFDLVDTILFENASGYSENYYIYKSENMIGSRAVEVR